MRKWHNDMSIFKARHCKSLQDYESVRAIDLYNDWQFERNFHAEGHVNWWQTFGAWQMRCRDVHFKAQRWYTYLSMKHSGATAISRCCSMLLQVELQFVICLSTALLNVQELSISLLACRLVFPKAGHRTIGRVVSWDHGCKLQDLHAYFLGLESRGHRPWGVYQVCRAINRLFACTLLLHNVLLCPWWLFTFFERVSSFEVFGGPHEGDFPTYSHSVWIYSISVKSCQLHRLFQNIPYVSLFSPF